MPRSYKLSRANAINKSADVRSARAAARDPTDALLVGGKGHPTTSDIEYDKDDLEFQNAIQDWKRRNNRQFPTWREVLCVVKTLGYSKESSDAASVPRRDFLD